MTDDSGTLTVPNIGLGYDPYLAFTKEGYAWTTGSAFRGLSTVEVEMKPGTDIEGVVLGPDGAPVQGAKVMSDSMEVKTDGQGRFRLSRCVQTVGHWPSGIDGIPRHVCAYWARDGVGFWAEVKIQLDTPLVAGVTLKLAPIQSRHYTVRGHVVHGETGQPVMASIYQNSSEGFGCGDIVASTAADGSFWFQVERDGPFWYFALPEDPTLYVDGPMLQEGNPEGKWDDKEIEFSVYQGCAIEGRAVSEDGTPITDKWVMCEPVGEVFHPCLADEDGRFTFHNLNGVGKTFELYVTDSFGRQGRVTVGPMKQGELRRDVEILLPPQVEPSRLRGTVRDPNGKPMPGMRLQLYFGDRPRPDTTEALTDDRGEYELKVLYSGPAKVTISSLTPGHILRHRVFDSDGLLLDATKDAEHDFTVSQEPEKM